MNSRSPSTLTAEQSGARRRPRHLYRRGPADCVTSRRVPASRSLTPRLEKLDRIARRVLQQDLRAAWSGDDVVAERHPGAAQSSDLARQVVDDEVDAIPA